MERGIRRVTVWACCTALLWWCGLAAQPAPEVGFGDPALARAGLGFLSAVLMSAAVSGRAADLPRAQTPLVAWRFQPGHAGVDPAEADWVDVSLPYVWTETWKRPPAAEGAPWSQQDLRDLNSAWYETQVTVPADWQGRRVALDLRGVQCDAIVWIGDWRLAEVKGPDGRVQITGSVAAGESARVRLWVTRWWEGTENQRPLDLFRDLSIQHAARSQWFHGEEEARRGIPAGISGGVSLVSLPPAFEITRAVVTTSVRTKTLGVSVEYRLLAPTDGASLRLQVSEVGGETDGLPAVVVPVQDVSADAQPHTQTSAIPWADPQLWDVGAPHLYLLHVSVVGWDGSVLDTYPPVRFGFREIWTEGRELILNGHPLRLRLSTFTPGVPQMLMYEGMGFNALAFQPNPTGWYQVWGLSPGAGLGGGTQELLDAADERGWAVLMPVPGVSIVRDALLKPEAEALYLRELRTWLQGWDRQNRASILMWTPSMNTQAVLWPEGLGRRPTSPQPAWLAKVEELVRSVDATRLIYHHQGGATGDVQTSNLYLNWVPLAEREEYLSAWSRQGDVPWGAVEHGSPLTVDFFRRARVPLSTEYAAIYLGDAAYAAEKDGYVQASMGLQEPPEITSPFDSVARLARDGSLARLGEWSACYSIMDRFIRSVNKAWRAGGQNGGMFPWFFDVGFGAPPGYQPGHMGYLYENLSGTPEELHQRPAWANPLYDAYRDTMQPLLVYLGGPPQRFTAVEPRYAAGESAERSIVAVWDGPGDKAFSAHWELEAAGKPVATGVEEFRMTPGATEKRPLRFVVPPITARTPAVLRLIVREAAGPTVARDQVLLTFFPRLPAPTPLTSRWGLYDPGGQTAAEWAKAGLKARPVALSASVADLDVLVIGSGALGRETRLPFTPEDVRRGLRVLVLEQPLEGLEALGFRAQDVVPRYVFPRVYDHPALAGLAADDLANWRAEGRLLPANSTGMRAWPWPHGPHWGNTGSVASVVIETPHRGAFTPLLECEFDLAYTPLLAWRHGRGEVVFSQLDFSGRLGAEPAADRLTRNLLHALDTPSAEARSKDVVLLGDDGEAKTLLDGLGLAWRAYAGRSPPTPSVVVVPETAASGCGWVLAPFVAAGGTVLLLPQTAESLASAGLPWPLSLKDTRAARVEVGAMGDDPLLRGIGPQLVHWRTFLEGNAFAAEGLPPGARLLLDGWLLRVGAGEGEWVFCQVDWRRLADGDNLRRTRWNTQKLYRQLLTNLGAATHGGLAEQLLNPRRFAPMRDVGVWQVLQQAVPVPAEVTQENALPGLGQPLEAEQWVQSPDAGRRKDFLWRLRAADKNGYLNLTPVSPAKLGQAGCAVTHVYSSVARPATLSLSADYWLVFRVNGAVVLDQSREPRQPGAPRPGEVRLRVPLAAGWSRLEARAASGSAGFGFWCQVSDPGDLRVSPTLTAPEWAPGKVPAPADLRAEPVASGVQLLYAEMLQKEDDPYGFTPW